MQIIFTCFVFETKDIISELLFYIWFWVLKSTTQEFVYVEDMDIPWIPWITLLEPAPGRSCGL